MTEPQVRDAAREAIVAGGDLQEDEVQVLEVQQRQGAHVAKYIVDGQPFERYERLGLEVADAE